MADVPEDKFFDNANDTLKFLKEHADDIELIEVPLNTAVFQIKDAQGKPRRMMRGVGARLRLCGGGSLLISKEDAEMLINDGVLQRLKIKLELRTFD